MSSASMVSCLLSVCYLVPSVPIIFKLALDWFQKLQCYSWKLWWRFPVCLSKGLEQCRIWQGEGMEIGVWWGKTEGVHICVCQLSVWESVLVCLDERNSVWWGKCEALICGRREIALLGSNHQGELPATLSLLFTLIIYQCITISAFPNKQINRAETRNASLSGSKMRN